MQRHVKAMPIVSSSLRYIPTRSMYSSLSKRSRFQSCCFTTRTEGRECMKSKGYSSTTNNIPKHMIQKAQNQIREQFGGRNIEFSSLDYLWQLMEAQKLNSIEDALYILHLMKVSKTPITYEFYSKILTICYNCCRASMDVPGMEQHSMVEKQKINILVGKEVQSIILQMLSDGITPSKADWSRALSCCENWHQLSTMLDVMYQIHAKRDWMTYHTAVHCLARYEKKDWRGVMLLAEAVVNDVHMDRTTGDGNEFYRFCLIICKKAEELPAAIAVFKSLRLSGIMPSREVFFTLLKHCSSNFSSREALMVFDSMCENDIDVHIEDLNLVLRAFRAPSPYTQSTIEEYFRGYDKQPDIRRAQKLFERFKAGSFGRHVMPDKMTYLAMMQIYRTSYPNMVFDLYNEMKRKDIPFLSKHIQELLYVCATHSNLEQAISVLKKCEKEGLPVSSFMLGAASDTLKHYASTFGPASREVVTASYKTITNVANYAHSNSGKLSHTGEVQEDRIKFPYKTCFSALVACDNLESLEALLMRNDRAFDETSVNIGSALCYREIHGVPVSDKALALLSKIYREKLLMNEFSKLPSHTQAKNIDAMLLRASSNSEWRHLNQVILFMSHGNPKTFPAFLTDKLLSHLLKITAHAPHAAVHLLHQLPVALLTSTNKELHPNNRRLSGPIAGLFQSIRNRTDPVRKQCRDKGGWQHSRTFDANVRVQLASLNVPPTVLDRLGCDSFSVPQLINDVFTSRPENGRKAFSVKEGRMILAAYGIHPTPSEWHSALALSAKEATRAGFGIVSAMKADTRCEVKGSHYIYTLKSYGPDVYHNNDEREAAMSMMTYLKYNEESELTSEHYQEAIEIVKGDWNSITTLMQYATTAGISLPVQALLTVGDRASKTESATDLMELLKATLIASENGEYDIDGQKGVTMMQHALRSCRSDANWSDASALIDTMGFAATQDDFILAFAAHRDVESVDSIFQILETAHNSKARINLVEIYAAASRALRSSLSIVRIIDLIKLAQERQVPVIDSFADVVKRCGIPLDIWTYTDDEKSAKQLLERGIAYLLSSRQ